MTLVVVGAVTATRKDWKKKTAAWLPLLERCGASS
jgi:hypothetical protein